MTDTTAPSMISRRYQLLDQLGKGGMGVVHRAFDRLTRQTVALKRVTVAPDTLLFSSRGDATHDVRLALAHEFRTLASLRHPYIIGVLDYGFDEQHQPYFTMDLLEDADPLLTAATGKPRSFQLTLMIQVLQALSYLHRRGILHRDLKPGNVLVLDDQVKVLDFGLASSVVETQTSTSGTLAYMAPELLGEQPASKVSDLYAVGMMTFELLAGQHPFHTQNLQQLVEDVLMLVPDVKVLEVDPDMALLLERMISKLPADRPTDTAEIISVFSKSIGQSIPSETASTRESFLQAAQFVGREAEMADLQAALTNAMTGKGSIWLVGGESGVGKSRLMEELRVQALVQGALVVRGNAISEGSKAYQPWRDPLRRLSLNVALDDFQASVLKALVPDIFTLLDRDSVDAPQLDPQVAQRRLFGVIEDLFRKQSQPILCILEDMHWARDESLVVLNRFTRIVKDLPVLFIVSYRDDERPDLPEEVPGVKALKLNRLTPDNIAQLSEAMLGPGGREARVLDLLRRETEGNAFFLVEVVRVLAEEAGQLEKIATMTLPETVFAGGVQLIVKRRLERVPKATRPLLQMAAVFGRELDLGILKALDPSVLLDVWLVACADAAVLEVYEGRWRFEHDKVRDGLLADLTPVERRTLHRRVAEAIESVYSDPAEHAAELANHWREAGDNSLERHYTLIAGEQALTRGANQDAIRFYERALALSDRTIPAQQADIERRIGEAFYGLGRHQESRKRLERALALNGRPMPTTPTRTTLGLLGQVALQTLHRFWPGRYLNRLSPEQRESVWEECRIHLQLQPDYGFNNEVLAYSYSNFYSLNQAESAGPSPELTRLYGLATYGVGVFGIHRLAGLYSRLAQDTARHIKDESAVALTYESLGAYALGIGNWEKGANFFKESARLSEKVGNRRTWGEVTMFRATLETLRGNFAEANALMPQIVSASIKNDDPQMLISAWLHQIVLAYHTGKTETVPALMESVRGAIYPHMGDTTEILAYGIGGMAYTRQSNMIAAQEMAEKALEVVRRSQPVSDWTIEGIAGAVETCMALWRCAEAPRDQKLWQQYTQKAMKFLAGYARPFPIGRSRKLLWQGTYQRLTGDKQAALKTYEQGLASARQLGIPYDEALLTHEIGLCKDGAEREKLLADAQAIFNRLGAVNELDQSWLRSG